MTDSNKIRKGNPLSKLASIWADARKQGNGPMVVVGVLLIVVGTLAAVGSVFAFSGAVDIAINGAGAEGIVTDMKVTTSSSRNGSGYSYFPIVSFRARNEQTYTFTSSFSDNNAEVGDKVRVLYNVSNPGNARIDSFGHLWGGGLILLGFGLFFAGVGVVLAGPFRSFISRHDSGALTPADIQGKREPMLTIMSVVFTIFGLGLFVGGVFVLVGQQAPTDGSKAAILFIFGAIGLFMGIVSFFAFKPSPKGKSLTQEGRQ